MSKIMQNLVVMMEPPRDASDISLKAGRMCLNRFCIDEDAAFELSGVYDLKNLKKRRQIITGKIASKLGLVVSFFVSNNQVFLKNFCTI